MTSRAVAAVVAQQEDQRYKLAVTVVAQHLAETHSPGELAVAYQHLKLTPPAQLQTVVVEHSVANSRYDQAE